MEEKTFSDLYNERKVKKTPAQEFVAEVASITRRTETTVRMWLSGQQTPDALAQSIIAEHFGVNVNNLCNHSAIATDMRHFHPTVIGWY